MVKAIYISEVYGEENSNNSIEYCTFQNNYANSSGGGFYLLSPGNFGISNCLFLFNTAPYGSSIYYQENSDYYLKKSKYKANYFFR